MSPPMGLGIGLGFTEGSAGPPGYTPALAPGLVLRVNADSLAASPVSSWSYGAANFTQATGAAKPTWTASSSNVNNKPSVLFSGAQFMSTPSTAALQTTGDWTICAAINFVSNGTFNCIIAKTNNANFEYDIYYAAPSISVVATGSGGTSSWVSSAVFSANGLVLITMIRSGNTVSFRKDRAAAGSQTIVNTIQATSNPVQIGQRPDGVTQLKGEMPELVMCNQALAGVDLTNLENYLRTRYGTP